MNPVNGPGVVRVRGVAVTGSGRQKQQVTGFHGIGLSLNIQERLAFGAVNQKIVAMMFPVHVMAHSPPVMAEGQGV